MPAVYKGLKQTSYSNLQKLWQMALLQSLPSTACLNQFSQKQLIAFGPTCFPALTKADCFSCGRRPPPRIPPASILIISIEDLWLSSPDRPFLVAFHLPLSSPLFAWCAVHGLIVLMRASMSCAIILTYYYYYYLGFRLYGSYMWDRW